MNSYTWCLKPLKIELGLISRSPPPNPYLVTASDVGIRSFTAECNPGEYATGGGYTDELPTANLVISSKPLFHPDQIPYGWQIVMDLLRGTYNPYHLTVHVTCAKLNVSS
jgi:hypothetical protein